MYIVYNIISYRVGIVIIDLKNYISRYLVKDEAEGNIYVCM